MTPEDLGSQGEGGSRAVRAALVALALGASTSPARAATYGVPTNLDAVTGQTTGASANPQGWLFLTGLDSPPQDGDVVHQHRFFIEVTGSTLDVRVFDPGSSGARDENNDNDLRTTFQLLNPCTTFPSCTGTVRSQVVNMNNDTAGTQNRLARFTPGSNGFFALDSGNANNVPFTGLSPGRYEFRISATTDSDDANFLGVDIRDAGGNSLNVFTIGRTANPDAALVTGTNNAGGAPVPGITQPIRFFPFVDRGCTLQPSNFDMDVNSTPGSGASASILDLSGATTILNLSGDAGDADTTVVVEPVAGVNTESTNYGMFTLSNNTGSQRNWLEWRVADFQGWSDPGNAPSNPVNPIRMYLPNRDTINGTGVLAPSEPVLRSMLRYISGPNPPTPGQATRFGIYGHLDNFSAQPITSALISVGVPAPATIDTSTPLAAFIEGTPTTCSSSTLTTTLAQCTFANPVPAGQTATILFFLSVTPPAPGTYPITGAPGNPSPNATVRASYSSSFGTTENPGPICELRVDTSTVISRATLRGIRVDPRGLVEFATATQKRTRQFEIYATDDPHGNGPRTLVSRAPILAAVPDSLLPILYRARTRPITTAYVVIEEIEHGGRRNALGPFAVGDAHLARLFERVEARLEQAGASSLAARAEARLVAPREQARLVAGGPRLRRQAMPPRRLGQGIRIDVGETGRVKVPFADLRANGLPVLAVSKLHLTHQGEPVPFTVEDDAAGRSLVFEARHLSTAYTGVAAYVLTWRTPAPAMRAGLTRWESPAASGLRRVERNSFFVPSAPQGDDPWLWDLLIGDGSPWPYPWDPQIGEFALPGLPGGLSGPVAVRIRFAGSSAHTHTIEARINGQPVGTLTFVGEGAGILMGEVPGEALLESGNQLTLVYTADASDPSDIGFVYLNHLELALPEPPLADVAPLAVLPYDPNLTKAARRADYLVLTHPAFEEQAERLAALKGAEGFQAAVLSVERAYDRYTGGIVEANALKALLQELAHAGRLRHVLLLGDDTFDPQDFMGMGLESFVPSLYAWDGQFGRIPSENLFADVDGDGRPDLAIGRLPAQDEAEASALVAKVARQADSLRAAAGRHLFGVDNDTKPRSFRVLADAVAAGLPPGSQITFADEAQGVPQARAILLSGLAQGQAVTHVFGHGGPEQWTDEALATVDDIEDLEGSPGEGLVLHWACESQWFQYPLDSTIGEALVRLAQGGAVASFGPAGISDVDPQVAFYQQLYTRLFQPGMTLGEAIRQAKAAALADPLTRPVVEGWNLLGDPALRLPPQQ
jgi:hypothetical protein